RAPRAPPPARGGERSTDAYRAPDSWFEPLGELQHGFVDRRAHPAVDPLAAPLLRLDVRRIRRVLVAPGGHGGQDTADTADVRLVAAERLAHGDGVHDVTTRRVDDPHVDRDRVTARAT